MPLSLETGLELEGRYQLSSRLKLGSIRKSIFTNLTENKRLDSESELPRVHSSWPLYDLAGQAGHIHSACLFLCKKLGAQILCQSSRRSLGAFYAGIGGEILYKSAKSPFALGFDLHRSQNERL